MHVCCMCGLQVAGADARMDKAEFVNLFKQLLAKIQGNPAPVAEAAASTGYTVDSAPTLDQ